MKSAYKRIAEVDKIVGEARALAPGAPIDAYQAIRLGLAVGLAIAAAINEVAMAVDEVARKLP